MSFAYKRNDKGAFSGEIANELNIPHSTVFTLCKEMDAEGHLDSIDHRNNDGKIEGYYQCEVVISHAGKHFFMTNSYKRKYRNQWWLEAPKRFWWIVALFAIITFALPLYLQYCNKRIQVQNHELPNLKKAESDSIKMGDSNLAPLSGRISDFSNRTP